MNAGALPPGQRPRRDFPAFGLPRYASRIPSDTVERELQIGGDALASDTLSAETLDQLPRIEQTSDFHCVTTWSFPNARWSGYRFADLYERVLAPRLVPGNAVELVVFRCRDGYRTALALADALAADVLVADRLDDAPLSIAHGAPLRLVAPAHYGYKNAKHLEAIELLADAGSFRKPGLAHYMDHPRARVAHEERGQGAPGWLLRRLYRPLIGLVVRRFRAALERPAGAS